MKPKQFSTTAVPIITTVTALSVSATTAKALLVVASATNTLVPLEEELIDLTHHAVVDLCFSNNAFSLQLFLRKKSLPLLLRILLCVRVFSRHTLTKHNKTRIGSL